MLQRYSQSANVQNTDQQNTCEETKIQQNIVKKLTISNKNSSLKIPMFQCITNQLIFKIVIATKILITIPTFRSRH